ncbi:MAG: alkaline phosphatase family protein [bacterium]|nr:alkaline phosphatase family protein [bacterium]
MGSPRVLIIGLDGATWDLFEPWAKSGRLPALARLMGRGTWGGLRSTVPALTLPAWATFMTGKNPGGHGVYGFRRLPWDRYEATGLANAHDLRTATMWNVAAAAGLRVGVVNVPPSYPLTPIPNGFVVGCMLTPPGEPFTSPPEVEAELGEYVIDVPPPKNLRRTDADYRTRSLDYLEALARQTRLRGDASLRLLDARPVDALCVVFYAPDRAQHYFWEYLDPTGTATVPDEPQVQAALENVFTELDGAVGRLVDAVGDDTTIVLVSDHGFGLKPERSIRLNRWLADHGHLRRRPLWKQRRRVVRGLLPEPWRSRYDTTDFILVDRARSRAWAETIFTGTAGVWINVRGRYPLGCVEPGTEYEAVREEIRRGLAELRDEHGRAVCAQVRRREDVYRGPFVEEAPDLVVECSDAYGVLFESLRRELRTPELFGPFDELGYTGTHRPEGLYLFAGPPFAALGQHASRPIEAIAPLVLYTLGVPIPTDFEAPLCTEVVRPEHLAANAPRYQDPVPVDRDDADGGWRSGDDEEKIAERLRALGYLA